MKKLFSILLPLIMALSIVACSAQDPVQEPTGTVQQPEVEVPAEPTPTSYTEGGYGAVYTADGRYIYLGEVKDDVLDLLGEETLRTEGTDSCVLYSWTNSATNEPEIGVNFDGDIAVSIAVANTPNYCLYCGISAGNSLTAVRRSFGVPAIEDDESLCYIFDTTWIPISADEAGEKWNAIYLSHNGETVTGFSLYSVASSVGSFEESSGSYDGPFEDAETAASMLETMIDNQLKESWPGEYVVSAGQDCVNLIYYYKGIAAEVENNASVANDVANSLADENLAILGLAKSLGLEDYTVNTILLDDTEEEPVIENALIIIINGDAAIRPDLQ